MTSDFFIIAGCMIGCGGNFLTLFYRKKTWYSSETRFWVSIISCCLAIISLIPIALLHTPFHIFYGLLAIPIFELWTLLLIWISTKKQNRDFYIYLKGSDDIDDSLTGKNPHVTRLDMGLSGLNLFGLMGTMFITIIAPAWA